MAVANLPDLNLLSAEALKQLIVAQHEQLLSRENEIAHLKLLLAKLQRLQFGRKSEKIQRQIEQLELRLEELESNRSEKESPAPEATPVATAPTLPPARPARHALPDRLPRQTRTHRPKETVCPQCQGELRKLGEDVSDILEYVPASFVVIQHVRPNLSCTRYDSIVQAEAPSRPIERGVAGPGLLAHVLASKYCDHLPLYRQSEMYARQGVELERSTLADWVGGSTRLLEPLVKALRRYVISASNLHADETPVPVLAPGARLAKPRQGVCVLTFAMIVPPVIRPRPQSGLSIHRTAKANIPSDIWKSFRARCRLVPTPACDMKLTQRLFDMDSP